MLAQAYLGQIYTWTESAAIAVLGLLELHNNQQILASTVCLFERLNSITVQPDP
jgi:hypothetical protein